MRRLLLAIPLLFVVSALTFVLASLAPGDAARQILGPNVSLAEYAKLRHALGLDQPLYTQYWHWLQGALHGDLGRSVINDQSVAEAVRTRFPVTLSLTLGTLFVSCTVGVSMGVFSALRGGLLGRVVDTFALVGFAVPSFWLGLQLVVVFAVGLRWLPATGYVPLDQSAGEWARSLVLPVAALSFVCIAAIAKQTREAMLDVLGMEFIRMAWANGIRPRSVIFRHALRNAALPVLTVVGVQAVALLGGTVVIETVFALPGMGSLVATAAGTHDLPMVVGVAVCFTMVVVVINLLVDLCYAWLNPRVMVR